MPRIFSPRTDTWVRGIALATLLCLVLGIGAGYHFLSPRFTRVGYTPEQPVPFSHSLHVGTLGMQCQYCHTHVEESPHATVPPTQTCLNCHSLIKTNSLVLSQIRERGDRDPLLADTKLAVEWTRVHRLPDYAYFNHAVHVKRGVRCECCHGAVNEMPVIRHDQPLSMGWCLTCHRDPQAQLGADAVANKKLTPPQSCQGCHR